MEEMEKRSRRRTRDLVTQAASQGLSQNEIGCARISMMARSTNAPCKGRIQMRKTNPLHFFTFGLQRTAGPYSWVKRRNTHREQMFSALPLKADMTLRTPYVRSVPKRKCFRRRAMSILAPIATDVSRSACRAAGGSHPTADWSGSNVISFTCAARELGYQYSNWVHPWEGRNGCYSRYC